MSVLTVARASVLDSRFRKLAKSINDELGFRDQRLRFSSVAARNGTTTWRLRNTHELEGHAVAEIASQLATAPGDASALSFAYNEEWQRTNNTEKLQFKASNLRFVIANDDVEIPSLQFRLEWAGCQQDGSSIHYPGKGAAHPHWQFDVEEGWFAESNSEEIEIQLEPDDEEIVDISLDDDQIRASPRRLSSTLSSFHRLHLPARAMWHDAMCAMPDNPAPQQHSPTDMNEIDRWLVSALRYIGHEFEAYM